jgi:hypothetical protein
MELKTIQCTYHQVGQTFLAGGHGGAVTTRYIVTRIEKGITYYREARERRIYNSNGNYSRYFI